MSVGVIIQARTGSTRFPRKVLADLNGSPVIQHVIDRCQQFNAPVILAVPFHDAGVFGGFGLPVHYGPEDDVLERYWSAAKAYAFDPIVRITSDCPLVSPFLMEEVYKLFIKGCSYAAIDWPRGGWPKGFGVEIFDWGTLDDARRYATDPHDREHVTPWMERYVRCRYLKSEEDKSHLNYCVDTPEDLERISKFLKGTNSDLMGNGT